MRRLARYAFNVLSLASATLLALSFAAIAAGRVSAGAIAAWHDADAGLLNFAFYRSARPDGSDFARDVGDLSFFSVTPADVTAFVAQVPTWEALTATAALPVIWMIWKMRRLARRRRNAHGFTVIPNSSREAASCASRPRS